MENTILPGRVMPYIMATAVSLPKPGAIVEGGDERQGCPAPGTHQTELLQSGGGREDGGWRMKDEG